MEDKIYNFIWNNNTDYFNWDFDGKNYEKKFVTIPQSVISLEDKSGFAIVGSYEEFGKLNAFIINADGSTRFLLEAPKALRNPVCFNEVYYVEEELTAILITGGVDFACVIDEETGEYRKIYETR